MSNQSRVLADIGGTNARFAWQQGPGLPLQHVQVLQCQDHAGLAQALLRWRLNHQLPVPGLAAIAVACAVQSDRVQLTNNPWSFSIQELQSQLELQRLVVANDFTALALGLPFIEHKHLSQIGGDLHQAPFQNEAPVALIGAGTGLGVSGLLPDRHGGWTPLSGEGGHISLSIHDELQHQIWASLQLRYGHVSAERVLSGQGLVNIHDSLVRKRTGYWPEHSLTPEQITALGVTGQDALASQAIELFCCWIGAAAGDLALTIGATGGVFIGGGIAPRLGPILRASGLRRCFEDKGRFSAYLKPLPIWVIDTPLSPALEGVSTLLD